MKILVICQYYYPEPFRISDICEELVKAGHQVTVVTGIPNYPMGEIYEQYKHRKNREEIINGVNVHRCFTIGRKGGSAKRFLNYYSFSFSSSFYISRIKDSYDVVFVNQLSPIIMSNAGILYKRKFDKRLVLYCLDLWPESLVAGGIKRHSFIFKYFKIISRKIYRSADMVLITSRMFREYLKNEFLINDQRITYLPQYAESIFSPMSCDRKYDGKINLVFAGNIGSAQSVQTILKAAYETKDIENLYWHIVGDGSDYNNCRAISENLKLSNVLFHGRKSLTEMPDFYSLADAMLVTMKSDPVISMTLPGKIQTYLAAGKPIIGAIDGDASLVIKEAKCGYCVPAEDYMKLADACKDFVNNISKSKELSINASKYYLDNFAKEKFLGKLESILDNNGKENKHDI